MLQKVSDRFRVAQPFIGSISAIKVGASGSVLHRFWAVTRKGVSDKFFLTIQMDPPQVLPFPTTCAPQMIFEEQFGSDKLLK